MIDTGAQCHLLSRQVVRSFFSDSDFLNDSTLSLEPLCKEFLSGNLCEVFCFTEKVIFDQVFSAFSELNHAYCLSYLILSDNTYSKQIPTVSILCYEKNKKIQCCGHGMLSVAFCWMQSLNIAALQLVYGGTTVTAEYDEGTIWLRFPRVTCKACELPDWLPNLLPELKADDYPVCAACTPASDGYLILEWPANTDLGGLPAIAKMVGRFTRRAVIYTARQSDSVADIQLRYFAPQYGQLEDTATGSAVRILADYWSPYFSHFVALQRSVKGGMLMAKLLTDSKKDSQEVAVGGFCQLVKERAHA